MTSQAAADDPVVVFVHVHYPEIWREMADALALRMNVPFHLVVTTSHAEDAVAVPRTAFLASFRVVATANRGRDILPFLLALGETPGFGIGLKLHTKKSPQRVDGSRWRNQVLESLVPSGFGAGGVPGPGTGVEAIVRRMGADARVGFVTPAGFALSVLPWVLVNRPAMGRVMQALGSTLVDAEMAEARFAAGSMFWFRREALAGLADPAVAALFEPEEGQFDGTAAHAMERLFPVVAGRAGFVSLSMTALEMSRPGMGMGDLLALARGQADLASTYFPAPTPWVAAPVAAPVRPPVSWLGRRFGVGGR